MKKIIKICGVTLLVFLMGGSLGATTIKADLKSEDNVESSETRETIRNGPIMHRSYSTIKSEVSSSQTQVSTSSTQAINNSQTSTNSSSSSSSSQSGTFATPQSVTVNQSGQNLIANPSFETMNSSGNPTNWSKGGYGTNIRELIYPVSGNGDAKAAQINIKTYTSGDAKWVFDDVSVTPGKKYEFSNYSKADVPSIITVRYKMSDGSFIYKDIATVSPSTYFQKNTISITVPPNVVSLTIFHLINRVGSLTVDTYSLNEVTTQTQSSLVPNGDFESSSNGTTPDSWKTGGWGTNSRSFSYPAAGVGGSKAVKVTISSYTNGDAKWYFNPIALSPGTYSYTDQYSSSVPTIITVQYENADGTFTYKDIAHLPAANTFVQSNATFSVGDNVKSVTVFHLISGVGTLLLDNVSITKTGDISGIFSTDAVSLRFDDGWRSQLQNAIPKMNQAGLKGTFYIVSHQVADYGFTDYMSINEVKQVYAMGHEIGGHTRTHPYLSTLSTTDQQNEISGGRSDILAWNVGPVLSFAYPFGDYNSTTIDIARGAGYQSALSTIDGNVTPTSDKFQLERQQPLVNTSFEQVKAWIDDAAAKKQWLILTFHQINTNGEQYSITPAMFNQIIDYLVAKKIPVMTVSEAMKSIQ